MKLALWVAAAALVFAAPAARSAGGAASDAFASCGPATVGGATVVTYCGPAKATFAFRGKTYRVFGGKCSFSGGVWTLLVGRQTLPPAKPKYTSFQALYLGKAPKAGTYTKLGFSLSFEIPGWRWSIAPGLPHKIVVTAGGKKGTFTAAFYTGTKSGTRKGSGSWTC